MAGRWPGGGVESKDVVVLLFSVGDIRRRHWHPAPVLLPGKSHGRRSLVGCSPWGRKKSDTLHFHFSLSCIWEGNGNPLQCSCLENFAYIRTAHMTDVLHTYHHSQEYTKVLMKFLKVDGIHEEHHRLFSILYSWKYIMSADGPMDSNLESKTFGGTGLLWWSNG